MSIKDGVLYFYFLLFIGISGSVAADITDYHVTDVTANSFTVIFSSTESIVAPDVKVYQDSGGQVGLAPQFDIISSAQHHANGLSAIRFYSLLSSATYYFNLTDNTAVSPYMPAVDLPSVTTMAPPAILSGGLITNDLIKLDIYKPNQITSLQQAIVLLSIPSVSSYPVSSFVSVNEFAYVDANNLMNGSLGTYSVQQGDSIQIQVLRGMLCAGSVDHLQAFYRKHGEDLELGTQINLANRCTAADTVCDDQINVLDAQFVLNSLNSTPSECRFTEELDVVVDQQINVLDVQQILNLF